MLLFSRLGFYRRKLRRGNDLFVKEYLSRLSRQVTDYPLGKYSEPQAVAAWRAMIWAAHKGDIETRAEAINSLVDCISFIRNFDVRSSVHSSAEAAKAFAWGFFEEEEDQLRTRVSRIDIENGDFAKEAVRAAVEQSEKRRRRRSNAILHWISRQDSLFEGADEEWARELVDLIIRLLPHGVDPEDMNRLASGILSKKFPIKARLRLQRGMIDVSRRWSMDTSGTAAVCKVIERLLPETAGRLQEVRLRWLAELPDQQWTDVPAGERPFGPIDDPSVDPKGNREKSHCNQLIREVAKRELRSRGLNETPERFSPDRT